MLFIIFLEASYDTKLADEYQPLQIQVNTSRTNKKAAEAAFLPYL